MPLRPDVLTGPTRAGAIPAPARVPRGRQNRQHGEIVSRSSGSAAQTKHSSPWKIASKTTMRFRTNPHHRHDLDLDAATAPAANYTKPAYKFAQQSGVQTTQRLRAKMFHQLQQPHPRRERSESWPNHCLRVRIDPDQVQLSDVCSAEHAIELVEERLRPNCDQKLPIAYFCHLRSFSNLTHRQSMRDLARQL